MSAFEYFFGLIQLLTVVGAAGFIAIRLRRRLMPSWDGALGCLIAAVTGIGLLTVLSELLGIFGLFQGWALVSSTLLIALLVHYRLGEADPGVAGPGESDPGPPSPPVPAYGYWLALLVTAVVVAQWGAFTSYSLDAGISNFDSVWYHLPFSGNMVQTGSTISFFKTETVFTNWFYPQNSELYHAISMSLTGRDFFSVLLNLGWLALALLAAWCIGRPYARPHLTLIAVAVLLTVHTLVVREPGTAKNDIVAIALILSAVAVLINRTADPVDAHGRLGPGWAMAAGGLAVGLAAGTKVTALAPAAMITFAVLFAAHQGTRLRSAGIWLVSGLLGGGFWYLRNLVATGNPIPQIEAIGSIQLPGPERLQQGRPDFTVLHYLTDTAIWRDYFIPGLNEGFGPLWPLLLMITVVGLVAVIWRGPGRLTRTHGFAALAAIAVYLVTPLSAAGAEGAPDAFVINLRFLAPALAMGLVLIPLVSWFRQARAQIGLAILLLVLFFVSGSEDAVWSEPGREFGVALALVFVVLPSLAWHYRDRLRASMAGVPLLRWAAGAVVVAGLLLSWQLADRYIDSRYNNFEPEAGLAEPYRWAGEVEDAEIGLAGTTAGFRQFGFFGNDLSNRLTYIGEEVPGKGFNVIRTCPEFRRAVNDAGLDYLVTSPFLNFLGDKEPIFSPERTWVADDRALTRVVGPGRVEVWRVDGPLDPSACPPGPGPESTPGLVAPVLVVD